MTRIAPPASPASPPTAQPLVAGARSLSLDRIAMAPSPSASPMLSVRTAASANTRSPVAGATNEKPISRAPQSVTPMMRRAPRSMEYTAGGESASPSQRAAAG